MLEDTGISVIVVGTGSRSWLTRSLPDISFPVFYDEEGGKQFRVSGSPTTFVVDGDGLITGRFYGWDAGVKRHLYELLGVSGSKPAS